jgi:hypothetical protein
MRNKSVIRIFIGAAVITGVFLLLHLSARGPINNTSTPCKESMDACCQKGEGGTKMIWEDMSHQFFSSI